MSGCFSLNAPKIEIIDETRKREKLNYLKPKGTIRNDKGTIWIELTFYWLKFILMVRLKIVFAFGQKIIGWEKNLFCRKKDQHLLLVFLFSLIVEWTLYFSLATLFLSWDKHFTGARALWQVYLIFLSECLNKMTSNQSATKKPPTNLPPPSPPRQSVSPPTPPQPSLCFAATTSLEKKLSEVSNKEKDEFDQKLVLHQFFLPKDWREPSVGAETILI